MELDKYQMIEMIAQDEEHESFKAYDSSDGHHVFMHAIRVTTSSGKPTELEKLARSFLATYHGPDVLLTGIRGGRFCVITEPRPECQNIRKWLELNSQRSPANSVQQDLGRAAVWSLPQLEKGRKETANPESVVNPTLGSQKETPPTAEEQGEFTRRFRAQSLANNSADSEPPAEAGEFTRRFRIQEDTSDASRHASNEIKPLANDAEKPEEFTRKFQAAQENPQTFTRSFERPLTFHEERELANSIPHSNSAEPSLSWHALSSRSDMATHEHKPVESVSVGGPSEEGPSDFTRVTSAASYTNPSPQQSTPAAVAAPAPAVPLQSSAPIATGTEPEQRSQSYVPLIVIMACLLLMAIMLIAYFVIKK
jgi:hypothetical protein